MLHLYNLVNKRLPGWQDPPTRDAIQAALREYDADGNGKLSEPEFEKFAASLLHAGPDMFFARECVLGAAQQRVGASNGGWKSEPGVCGGGPHLPEPPANQTSANSDYLRHVNSIENAINKKGVGKNAVLKTALLPAVTLGVKNSAGAMGLDGLKDVPTAVSRWWWCGGGDGVMAGWWLRGLTVVGLMLLGGGQRGTIVSMSTHHAALLTAPRALHTHPPPSLHPVVVAAGPGARARLRRRRHPRARARLSA